MLQQYLEVGKITNVHGLMGEVRVQPWADSPEFLCRFKTLYVDKTHWPIQVERARVTKNMAIIKFHGVTDVPSALAMRNAILYIDRNDVQLPEGSFFLADIMGLEARDAQTGAVRMETGTVCMTEGAVRFRTTEDGVIPAGELSVTVAAEAEHLEVRFA